MKRHALFVGVNNYEDQSIRKLNYSIPDASVLDFAFKQRGYETRLLSDPSRTELLKAVQDMVRGLGTGDVFLFFFAGHGFTAQGGAHLLFCKDDLQQLLRVNNAGISVDALETLTDNCGCNRIFMLDACRTDVFANVALRGNATRNLALVNLPDAKTHPGTCCVLRSCDKFCPALELDKLGHGVFTQAILDIVNANATHGLLIGQDFVKVLRAKMHDILGKNGILEDQNPDFQTNGNPFPLFDGDFNPSAPLTSAASHSAPKPQKVIKTYPNDDPVVDVGSSTATQKKENAFEFKKEIFNKYRILLAESASSDQNQFTTWQQELKGLCEKDYPKEELIKFFNKICNSKNKSPVKPFFKESRRLELELALKSGQNCGDSKVYEAILSSLSL